MELPPGSTFSSAARPGRPTPRYILGGVLAEMKVHRVARIEARRLDHELRVCAHLMHRPTIHAVVDRTELGE